jgi:aminocarboxymuconate-semialdehyde decarboxylase
MDETNNYGPTAARSHGRPGRETRPSSITIDMHSHIWIPEADDYVRPHLDISTIPLARFSTPPTRALNRKQDQDRTPTMRDHAVRLADMDAAGIDMQVVMSAPPQCFSTVAPEVAVVGARMVNDGIGEWISHRPDRFVALGSVAMQAPDEAVAELERIMALGFKGVQIITNIGGKELSDPLFAPFWAAAERLGAVVLMHPIGFTDGARLERFYFNNVIGNPFETTLALHYLIFDGVLARHPALKLIAVHGGGYLAGYSGRIDHAWGARTDCQASLPLPPTTYLKRVFFDTVVFTPHQLRSLIDTFGADQLLMGTDYPYDMAESDPVGHLRSLDGLDEAVVSAIAGGNAAKLFGIVKTG